MTHSSQQMLLNRTWQSVALGLLTLLLLSGELQAQADSTPAEDPGLKFWWMRNAASFHPRPEKWLFHVEADYSFTLQSGNIEGMMHNGRGRLFLRKGRTTFSTQGGIQSQKLSLASGVVEIKQERYRVVPTLDYDITPALGLQAGFFWEHDDAAFIETREIGYVGVKTIPYNSERLIISVLPAFGYQHEQAILTGEERSFWSPYIEETISWQPLQQLHLTHLGNVLLNLEDSEAYRWRIANGIEVPITSYLSIMFNHEFRFNNKPIPSTEEVQRLTNGQGTISREDTEITVGFRLQY